MAWAAIDWQRVGMTDAISEELLRAPGDLEVEQIEHSLFSFIARNWRGQPLVSRQAIVSLIAATTSTTGLKVYARLDEGEYQRAVKVSDAEIAAINLARAPRSSSRSWSRRARGGRPEIGVGCAKHQRCGCTLPERSLHA